MEVSIHAFNRINTRITHVRTMKQARKMASEAYRKGYTAEQLRPEFKHLANYLDFKLKGESERTEVRIYKDFVWLWNGRQKILRTVYPIEKTIPCKIDLKKLKKKEAEQNDNKRTSN